MSLNKVFDFTCSEDQEVILNLYGGEENMKESFPFIYEAFVNACQANLETKTKGFISKAQVHSINYDQESLQYKTTGNAVLNEKADLLQNVIEIYKNDVRIAAKMNVYHNSQYSYLSCETDNMGHHKNDNIKVVVTAVWRTRNNILKACTLSNVLFLNEYDYIYKFTNIHPMKQPNINPKNRITVTYAREPENETYDYIFPESRISSGEENVSLNIEGDIILKADWQYDSLENYEITMWSVERGVVEYQGEAPIITTNNNGFHYKFPIKNDRKGREYCEWNDYIDDSVRFGNQDYDYNCKINFKVKNKKTNAIEKQCIEVTTLDVPHKPVNTEFIPMLRLFWGCIGEESMILMADGSLRRIEDIKIGDYICTPESMRRVKNVHKGHEEMILHLETKTGKTLNLCLNHPLLTTEGYIPARDLTSKSQLITYDRNIDYVNFAYEIKYNKCVYSLEIDNADGFYAENLVVGSFETENRSLNQNQLEATKLTQEQNDEIEMLKEAFENGEIFR